MPSVLFVELIDHQPVCRQARSPPVKKQFLHGHVFAFQNPAQKPIEVAGIWLHLFS
jgi:hypothetical protein